MYDFVDSYQTDYILSDSSWEESKIYKEFAQALDKCKKKLDEVEKKEVIDENQLPF